ncbi:MAG: N-acetyl-gamma-glutamyl-phosphate reductase, partial [Ramlibacter sp.]|nr:N-acetyl-gamma-glutamyl-phosphate reductase [Ramlibacter sp.]
LCLPDDASRETVALADSLPGGGPRILDASTAHRVASGWAYGFPELTRGQADAIRAARRVANPGCYATGAIALLRPLVEAGLIPSDHAVTINAVSGYSGGGKTMIEAYEAGGAPPFELYALGLEHKHVPEIQAYAQLTRRVLFVPSVGNFRQGMLVQLPLHLNMLPGKPEPRDLEGVLQRHYKGSEWVTVEPATADGKLEPTALNDTNKMELRVYVDVDYSHAVLVARLDNLGKGASGAAVQNLKLMLGL